MDAAQEEVKTVTPVSAKKSQPLKFYVKDANKAIPLLDKLISATKGWSATNDINDCRIHWGAPPSKFTDTIKLHCPIENNGGIGEEITRKDWNQSGDEFPDTVTKVLAIEKALFLCLLEYRIAPTSKHNSSNIFLLRYNIIHIIQHTVLNFNL